MLHRPSLIFLDEPTAGLDSVAAAALRDDIAALVKAGDVTVFLNTHNLPEAEKLCSQVGVIRNGRLLSVGSLRQLRVQSIVKEVIQINSHLEISLSNPGEISSLLGLLIRAGAQVEEVHKNKASLEVCE